MGYVSGVRGIAWQCYWRTPSLGIVVCFKPSVEPQVIVQSVCPALTPSPVWAINQLTVLPAAQPVLLSYSQVSLLSSLGCYTCLQMGEQVFSIDCGVCLCAATFLHCKACL